VPTIGLAELTMVVGYLVVIGLVIALPFWAIGQIRRNRRRVDQLERRVTELESRRGPDRT
jgi:type III secretory pathway component EscT